MEYRDLGNTSITVSRLGIGCGTTSGRDYGSIDESKWIAAVGWALDRGITFFDVADVYGFGRAEELLSLALGEKRHDVVIATKGGLVWDENGRVSRDATQEQIARAIENSLRRLRVDIIPLYQIHWPDPATLVEETLETVLRFQQQGKVRHIGVSNFPLELLRRASRSCRVETLQVAYNLLSREIETDVLSWCTTQAISVIAHTGLARGLLAGKRPIGLGFGDSDTRNRSPYFSEEGRVEKQQLLDAIRSLSGRTGRSIPSIALRWVLDNPMIATVLVGVKDQAQLEENLEAVDWQLDQADRELLSSLSDTCPKGLAGKPAHEVAIHRGHSQVS